MVERSSVNLLTLCNAFMRFTCVKIIRLDVYYTEECNFITWFPDNGSVTCREEDR